jgi:hypothetical protein
MALYLSDLETLVRGLIFESSSDTGLVTQAQLQAFIQRAHRDLYSRIARVSPSVFRARSADKTITSSGYDFSGTNLDAGGVLKIQKVEYKDATGNYSALQRIDYDEVGTLSTTQTRPGYVGSYQWTVLGTKIYLIPQNNVSETIRIVYVPGPTDIASNAYPFGGLFPESHDIVGYRAADLALTKDEKPSVWHGTFLELWRDFQESVRAYVGQRKVKMSPFEDYG